MENKSFLLETLLLEDLSNPDERVLDALVECFRGTAPRDMSSARIINHLVNAVRNRPPLPRGDESKEREITLKVAELLGLELEYVHHKTYLAYYRDQLYLYDRTHESGLVMTLIAPHTIGIPLYLEIVKVLRETK